MKLLIVSATEFEVRPLLDHLENTWAKTGNSGYTRQGNTIDICLTGVGMVATTYALTKALVKQKYQLVMQTGVCGSYDRQLNLGDLVYIKSDQFGDLGAEDHDKYLDIFEMGLLEKYVFPFTDGELVAPKLSIPAIDRLIAVSGLTVNTVSGNEDTIKKRIEKFDCRVESMEGAAFHYAGLNENIPFAQVRCISNYIEPRDKSKWKMKETIIALNKWLIDFVEMENDTKQ